MSSFVKASREKTFLKAAFMGPSGSGKSFTSLVLAGALKAAGLAKRFAVIDAENGKIKKYAGYVVDGQRWEFDVAVLTSYSPQDYSSRIQEAARAGYDLILIDGISQEWTGKNGALETVDQLAGKNKFTSGWAAVTPMHNSFVESILAVPAHVLCTVRTKMGYILEEQDRGGKTVQVPKRVGMEPIQRNGIEYEFECLFDVSTDHIIRVAKTICPDMDGQTAVAPKASYFAPLIAWLSTGDDIQVDFHYGFIETTRVQGIIDRITAANGKIDDEREWIFQHYACRGFDQMTNDQARKYESSRLALLEEQAAVAAAASRAAAPAPAPAPVHTTPVPQSHGRSESTPTSKRADDATTGPGTEPATSPGTAPAAPAPPQTLQQAMTEAAPEASASTGTGYVRPKSLEGDVYSSVRNLFEEMCFLLGMADAEKPAFLKNAVLDRFGVPNMKVLSHDQLLQVEEKFVNKIRALHIERGTPGACPF